MKKLVLCLALSLFVSSASIAKKPDNAFYAGEYKGVENNLTKENLVKDINAATQFISNEKYSNRFVTVFGSSRIGALKNNSRSPVIVKNNKAIYEEVRTFAKRWTAEYGELFPVMTGAGPGIMEAASRGAMEAGGPSIGYTTYYGPARTKGAEYAFMTYEKKDGAREKIITDGLIFSSVALREYYMIMHSKVAIFSPGGTGTEWELYQTIEKIKSKQLNSIPIYLIGDKELHWKSFYDRINDMSNRGTIDRYEVESLIVHVHGHEELLRLLEKHLKNELKKEIPGFAPKFKYLERDYK